MYGVDMDKPGGQDYYDSILKLYAGWGVDFIKADDIARPAHREEIAALHQAIQKTGRPIVLSLSPGPADGEGRGVPARERQHVAHLGRFLGRLEGAAVEFHPDVDLERRWQARAPGRMPICFRSGRIGIRAERGDNRMTRFTHDEQRTLISLWSIAQSPLMFGGDLPSNDDFTNSLLTNDEVLEVNQKGSHGGAFAEEGDSVVWKADGATSGPNSKYFAVFNVGDRGPIDLRVEWQSLGMPESCALRDLWEHKDLDSIKGGYTFHVSPHASGLYKLQAQ